MKSEKVQLISHDLELFQAFNDSGLFQSVKIGGEMDAGKEYEVLVLSDRVLSYTRLMADLNAKLIKAEHIFYLLSYVNNESQLNSYRSVLTTKSVNVIPPRLTAQQVVDRVCTALGMDRESNRNSLAFLGADSKVGTSLTAQAVAEQLAKYSEKSVCFLNLSTHPFNYFHYNEGDNPDAYGMDAIKTKIFNEILTPEELKAAMVTKNRLSLLPPVKTLTDYRLYKPKQVEYLIQLASMIFDLVVIDGGHNPNSGLYIGALNAAKARYMVTTQTRAAETAFLSTVEQLYKLQDIDLDSFLLVINRYTLELNLPDAFKLSEVNYGMVLAATLPNVEEGFFKAEAEHRTLRGLSQEYDRALDELTRVIATQLSLTYQSPQIQRKTKMFSLFGKKKEA